MPESQAVWLVSAVFMLALVLSGCRTPQSAVAPDPGQAAAPTGAKPAVAPTAPAWPLPETPDAAPGDSPALPGPASAALAPQGSSYDWSVPAIFRSHIVSQHKRGFPQKLIALTFDDGPAPSVTPVVLAKLKKYGAHATFFMIGYNASRFPDLVRQAAEEGHCVGVHSYSHIAQCTPALAIKNLHLTARHIEQATGKKPTVFRPPYGICTNELTKLARREGYPVIMWSMSSADTDRRILKNADLIARNVIHTPRPGDFVLMHDGGGHLATAEALSQILPQLQKAGWKFVTVPELLRAWAEWMATQPPRPGSGAAGPTAPSPAASAAPP